MMDRTVLGRGPTVLDSEGEPRSPSRTKPLGHAEPSTGLQNVNSTSRGLGGLLGVPTGTFLLGPDGPWASDISQQKNHLLGNGGSGVAAVTEGRAEAGTHCEEPRRQLPLVVGSPDVLPASPGAGPVHRERQRESPRGPLAQPALLGLQWEGHGSLASGFQIPTGGPHLPDQGCGRVPLARKAELSRAHDKG